MSSIPSLPFNRLVHDPSLMDLLNLFKTQVMQEINCHAIAQIQSVDYTAMTVEATIVYCLTYWVRNSETGDYEPNLVDYPVLLDVPFIVIGGGSGYLTFPIQPGDECLILFNDRDFSNWFSDAPNGSPVASTRLHSLADGIALIGLRSVSNYSSSSVVLANGNTQVDVGSSQVTISNGGTKTLGQAISDLTQALETFLSGLNPTTLAGQAASALTAVTAAATEISGLLG